MSNILSIIISNNIFVIAFLFTCGKQITDAAINNMISICILHIIGALFILKNNIEE